MRAALLAQFKIWASRIWYRTHRGTCAMSEDSRTRADALIAFKARNVRCYRDEATLSLGATRVANSEVVRNLATASAAPTKVLPSAGVFGANGSGKSALLRAMHDMQALVVNSFRQGSRGTGLRQRPFMLGAQTDSVSSELEVELVLDGVFWQYGFEFDEERVLREYAYHFPRGRQAMVFERQGDSVTFGASLRAAGRALVPILRENALVLSVLGATKDRHASLLYAWWRRNLHLATAWNRPLRSAFTARLATAQASRSRVLGLINAADRTAVDIKVLQPDADTLERLRQITRMLGSDDASDEDVVVEGELQLVHRGSESNVAFDSEDESEGTRVWIGLIGPVIEALAEGSVLLVDEIDASLHPHLVARLIDLFQDPRTNPKCAQLVFNAHDTNILGNPDSHALGRDQIWFTEKNEDGACHLYSLADFRPRRDESVQRGYLSGRYGGIPELYPMAFGRSIADLGAVPAGAEE